MQVLSEHLITITCPFCQLKVRPEALGFWGGWAEGKKPPYWQELRLYVFRRDKYKCRVCHRKFTSSELVAHHVIPKEEGGTDSAANLITVCHACNPDDKPIYPDEEERIFPCERATPRRVKMRRARKHIERGRILICPCGRKFYTVAPHIKYCANCHTKQLRDRRKEPETRICERCGDEYETTRDWSRFCSSHCRNVYHRERYDADLLKEKGGER